MVSDLKQHATDTKCTRFYNRIIMTIAGPAISNINTLHSLVAKQSGTEQFTYLKNYRLKQEIIRK